MNIVRIVPSGMKCRAYSWFAFTITN